MDRYKAARLQVAAELAELVARTSRDPLRREALVELVLAQKYPDAYRPFTLPRKFLPLTADEQRLVKVVCDLPRLPKEQREAVAWRIDADHAERLRSGNWNLPNWTRRHRAIINEEL